MFVSRGISWAARLGKQQWNKTQVELHGSFSRDHVHRFEQYVAQTSTFKALLVCLWTPVPAVCMALVIESIPMEDPASHTARQSPFVWLRAFVMLMIASMCFLEQLRQYISALTLTRRTALAISVVASVVTTAFQFILADQIAYPFPFSVNVADFVWVGSLAALFGMAIRAQLAEGPHLATALRLYGSVYICQMAMAVVYPLYNAAFVSVSAWKQTALALVLPVIKIAANNWISRSIDASNELRAETVIFNVEVFHAMYVSFSMQNSTAIHTVAATLAVDFVHAWLSFYDMAETMNKISPLTTKPFLHNEKAVPIKEKLSPAAVQPTPHPKPIQKMSTGGLHSQLRLFVASSTVHPQAEAQAATTTHETRDVISTTSWELFSSEERDLLTEHTQKLLCMAEFVALVEYTEVVIPIVFNMYMVVMFFLPNRQYYSFLRGLSIERLQVKIANVSLYASLELASLATMAAIVWHKLRLSLLHQIAFVLEHRQASVQSKVLMWALFVMQTETQQAGVDYTFKFAWLRSPTA